MFLVAALALTCLIPANADVSVPFRVTDDAIIVESKVNGRQVSLMFDSGFSGAVVINSALDIGPKSGKATIRDFVGEIDAETVDLSSLNLGGQNLDVEGMHAILQPLARMSIIYNVHADGLLGLKPLESRVTEINFEKGEFIFHSSSLDLSQRKPDGKRTFLVNLLPLGNGTLEMPVDTSNGKSMVLALDTGNAFFATTHRDVLERVGFWNQTRVPKYQHSAQIASGSVESWSALLKNLKIFSVPVQESVWDVIERPASQAESDGTVGFQFLRNFNITFDYKRRLVWFENFTGKTGGEPLGETGIYAAFDRIKRRVVVYDVAPDSPAERAGVKEGDELISIDDLDLTTERYRQLKKLLSGDVGSRVRVSLSHGGDLQRLTLERVPLVNLAG